MIISKMIRTFLNNKLKKIKQAKNRNRAAVECLRELGFPLSAIRKSLVTINELKINDLAEEYKVSPVTIYEALKARKSNNGKSAGMQILAEALGVEVKEIYPPAE